MSITTGDSWEADGYMSSILCEKFAHQMNNIFIEHMGAIWLSPAWNGLMSQLIWNRVTGRHGSFHRHAIFSLLYKPAISFPLIKILKEKEGNGPFFFYFWVLVPLFWGSEVAKRVLRSSKNNLWLNWELMNLVLSHCLFLSYLFGIHWRGSISYFLHLVEEIIFN